MPVPLRTDFDAAAVRALARRTKDGPQARRLLTLAAVYDGASRTEAARIGGVGLQIVRDCLPARRRASSRTQGAARGWPDPGCPRRGALASDRSDGLAVGGVPRHDLQADTEPRAAGDELSQALGPSAPSRQERGGC